MESTDSLPEEAVQPTLPVKEAAATTQVAGEEAGSVDQITRVSEDPEVNGTENSNGHNETPEEPMDTSETAPTAESAGSTETTPVKTKAAMKDVSGMAGDNQIAEHQPEKTDEEPSNGAFDVVTEGVKSGDEPEEDPEEKAQDNSEERVEENSVEKNEEDSEEKAQENSEEKVQENSEEKNGENSEEKTQEYSEEKTRENSEEKTQEKSEEKAQESSEETAQENLEEKAEEDSGKKADKEEEGKPKDAFDAMLSGQENEKPKDAFDSMVSGEKVEEKSLKKVDVDSDYDAFDSGAADAGEVAEKVEEKDEVVTVEDDGKPFEPEESWLKEYKNDEDYFASLDKEELDWYKENGPKVETAGESGLKCTSCFKNVTIIIGSHNGVTRHFKLGVGICKGCKYFYKDGSGWEQDDEGLDKYCRWCGQGGEIIICDKCPSAFCKRCLQRNLGRNKVTEITSAEEWKCLFCDPKQIYELRAIYHAVYQRFKSGNFKKPEVKTPRSANKSAPRSPVKSKPEPVSKEKIDSIRKSPRNFVDENIFEAFKTLDVYQKCLEQERDRWIKNTKAMSVDSAVSTCRALRKIYAITKQNMDLLDKAIVQSFVEKYPKDSVKIHMGKVGVKVKEGALTGKPVSVKGHTKVKLKLPAKKKKAATPKRKVLPKKKKKAAAPAASPKKGKGKTQEVVIMNGSPVYADPDDHDIFQVVRPSLSRKKAGPASKTNKKQQLYTKNKATRYSSDDDSDVVTLSSDDERPSKPGPASRKRKTAGSPAIASPPKKRRPGPKSRTH